MNGATNDDDVSKDILPVKILNCTGDEESSLSTQQEIKKKEETNSVSNGDHHDVRKKKTRRKLDLMWCGREYCADVIRERIVGEDNNMEFEGPATGQVCYVWQDPWQDPPPPNQKAPTVLLLVRRGDEELLEDAAQAVRELTESGICVLLSPDLAARIKHYHGVDGEGIRLFEPIHYPGFGGNHVELDDQIMGDGLTSISSREEEEEAGGTRNPDLICTFGGDGLLLHASILFPGPVPPILCVAGGSLGFLTPFAREELVEAVKISLGLVEEKAEKLQEFNPEEIRPSYEPMKEAKPEFELGRGNRICLSMRMRLDVKVINREGVVRARFNVLNEVVIDRGGSPYLAALECFVDENHLTTVQADGIIFATPTGSTAYSMSAGGSVVHPAVPAILVTPICPHVLSFRSMIFPDSVVLRCYVPDDARSDASVAFDGKYRRQLHRGDSVQIQMSQHPVPTINRGDHSADWLNSLKRNFNFNSRPRQKPL